MATATYNVTTSTDLKEVWRKVQYGIVVAAQFGVEEWQWLNAAKKLDVNWSAREITMELDINDGYGTAMIPEGGKEARPSSPTAVTANFTWVLANKRFTISKTAQYIQQQQGTKGQLESQLKFQAKKALQSIRRKIGDQFYGISSGIQCSAHSIATDDIVVDDMHGVSGLGGTSANRRCVDLFRVGDVIALVDPSTHATIRGTAAITAITRSSNTLTGTAVSDMTGETAGDAVLFANNLENTTTAGGTEHDLNLIGFLDGFISDTIHGVSAGTYAKWAAGYSNTSGGRFTGVTLRKMKQGIENNGGGTLTDVIWTNGVENDVFAQLQAGLRFSDSFGMEMDGSPKSKGVTFHTSPRVPDGYVFGYDKGNSVHKMVLLPEPGAPAFEDGDKMQDDSGLVFSLDFPVQLVYTNRSNLAYCSSVTEQ